MFRRNDNRAGARLLAVSVITGLWMLVSFLAKVVFRDWIIVCYGIRVFKLIDLVGNIVAGICGVFWGSCLVLLLKQRSEQRKTQEQEQPENTLTTLLDEYSRDKSPEMTRQVLQSLPGMRQLAQDCIARMDKMDALQERLETLIKINQAHYINTTIETFDRLETWLCQKMNNIINLYVSTHGGLSSGSTDNILDEVDRVLQESVKLLERLGEFVNSHDNDEGVDMEIEALTKAINTKIGGTNDEIVLKVDQ